jgi:hypothetical protein
VQVQLLYNIRKHAVDHVQFLRPLDHGEPIEGVVGPPIDLYFSKIGSFIQFKIKRGIRPCTVHNEIILRYPQAVKEQLFSLFAALEPQIPLLPERNIAARVFILIKLERITEVSVRNFKSAKERIQRYDSGAIGFP